MKITHIFAQNFCKFYGKNTLDTDFSMKTVLSGQNEVGKSTVKGIILDVLNCHDENDREITGIRPHDESGAEIDDVDIVRAVTFEIDGKSKTLKKVTRQKRNKKGEITGSVTDYSINDVPYKMADYNQYINDNMAELGVLPFCLNAMTLLNKSQAEQRLALASYFGTRTDEEICDMFPQFAELKPMFDDGDVDQLKKVCRGKLNGTGGRNGSKGLVKERDEISTRIDTIHSTNEYTDLAELELQKKTYEPQLKEIEDKLSDYNKILEDKQKATEDIMNLKFELSDMEREANADNQKKRMELQAQLDDFDASIHKTESMIRAGKTSIESTERKIGFCAENLEKVRADWKKTKELVFDESSVNCPMCGQKLPEDKIESMRADFDERKAKNLKELEDRGNALSNDSKEIADLEKELKQAVEDKRAELKELTEKRDTVTKELEKVPTDIDMTGNSEYQALKAKIEEKEKALADENDTSELIRKLKNERNELLRQVSSVDTKIELGVANNKRIDDSIADLEDKRKDLNQEIADWERKLDLLKEFTRKKNELLQPDVNKYLNFATAKLFRPLLNGDTEECCDFVYNGEAYARNLNHGARMLTEVDICRAFQKVANVNFPIIIDDTESVDDWRIPQIDNQLILLKHTQDKELVIEAV
jgi:predicted  nucleic acid-binding Zn-ribbon protein|nr:MAG TPA: chromosome partition protein [Caudoviricetes sp.]